MKKLDRRQFAKHLAAVPVTLSAASALLARAEAPAQAPTPKPTPPAGADNNRFSVDEPSPFAAPLNFVHSEVPPKLQFFALGDVTLDAGPLLDARAWNRA
ncbi:MAG: hypothetical protein ACRD3S_03425, partial [Terracidiphilus sp.]